VYIHTFLCTATSICYLTYLICYFIFSSVMIGMEVYQEAKLSISEATDDCCGYLTSKRLLMSSYVYLPCKVDVLMASLHMHLRCLYMNLWSFLLHGDLLHDYYTCITWTCDVYICEATFFAPNILLVYTASESTSIKMIDRDHILAFCTWRHSKSKLIMCLRSEW
jgi:hypothetical protein